MESLAEQGVEKTLEYQIGIGLIPNTLRENWPPT
jgi:hypothetical protein